MEAIVMLLNQFPVIDLPATGANIRRLRQTKGLSVRDIQQFFGFEEPRPSTSGSVARVCPRWTTSP
jgi:hypothetical protein